MWRSLFGTCSLFWEDFRHMLSNELSISGSNFLGEQTPVNTSKAEFVDFGLDFGDLFRTLLCWKHKLLNNLNRSLVTLGPIIIFPPTKRQAASGWNTDRLFPEAVCNFNWLVTDTFIGLLWIWYRVHDQCSIYGKIATNHRMYTSCSDVPSFLCSGDPDIINQVNNYSHVRVGVLAAWRISDMFWRLLRWFLCGKGERKNYM